MSRALTWLSRGGWRMLGLTAEQLGTVLLAVSLLITGRLAQQKGKEIVSKAPPQDAGNTVELRGAVISDKAADRIVQSMDAFTASATMLKSAIDRDVEAKQALTKALGINSASMDRNSDVSQHMREEIRETGDAIGRLKDEMIRSQRGGK